MTEVKLSLPKITEQVKLVWQENRSQTEFLQSNEVLKKLTLMGLNN